MKTNVDVNLTPEQIADAFWSLKDGRATILTTESHTKGDES